MMFQRFRQAGHLPTLIASFCYFDFSFTVHYDLSGIPAGMMAAVIVMFGSCFRPVGGWLADRIGGVRALEALFGIVALAYFASAYLPAGPISPSGAGWALLAFGVLALTGLLGIITVKTRWRTNWNAMGARI
jgi:nitrate/nitrite transporter NarK